MQEVIKYHNNLKEEHGKSRRNVSRYTSLAYHLDISGLLDTKYGNTEYEMLFLTNTVIC